MQLIIRDLRSFEIRFEFKSAVPIRFEVIAHRRQMTQTINGT